MLDCDIAEAGALEFASECADFAEVFDDPALAEFAVDGYLRTPEFAGTEKAVCNDEAASGAKKSMGFADEAGFV